MRSPKLAALGLVIATIGFAIWFTALKYHPHNAADFRTAALFDIASAVGIGVGLGVALIYSGRDTHS